MKHAPGVTSWHLLLQDSLKDPSPEKTGARKLGTKRSKPQGKAEQAGSLRRAQPLKLAQFLSTPVPDLKCTEYTNTSAFRRSRQDSES